MDRLTYEEELHQLQVQLVYLQAWVKEHGKRIVIVFEGRDAAGKGGVIKAITERVSPRIFRIVALPAPSDREKTQLYTQRYIKHLPAAGEIVIFDRSWYNRAGVESVMGFCQEDQVERFLNQVPYFEREIQGDGIILLKYWLEISSEEQHKRFKARIEDPLKQWKLSNMDLESRRRWYAYSRARDRMFDASDTEHSPWYIVPSDSKREGRLRCIRHLLSQIPYEQPPQLIVNLPRPDESQAYDDKATMKRRRYV